MSNRPSSKQKSDSSEEEKNIKYNWEEGDDLDTILKNAKKKKILKSVKKKSRQINE